MTEITIAYAESPLNGPSLSGVRPKPGERAVPVAHQAPVGSGRAPLFALCAEKSIATADLIRRFDGLLDPELRPAIQDGALWLVRPDGYVACSSRDPGVVAGYLDSIVRPG
jgi:hypothetical protein